MLLGQCQRDGFLDGQSAVRLRISGFLRLFGCSHGIELTIKALEFHLAGTHGGIGLVVSGTEPIVSAFNICNQGSMLNIVSVDSGGSSFKSAIHMGAADYHVDVQLCAVHHCIEVITALGFFHIHIHCCSGIGGGGHVVAVHCAGQVIDLVFQVALGHTKLICAAHSRRCKGGFFRLALTNGVELTVEALIFHLAGTDGGKGLIISGAKPVCSTVNIRNQRSLLTVIGVNGGRSCFIGAIHMGAADYHVDVQLRILHHGIEIVAALGLFQENIRSLGGIGGGGHVIAVHCAGQVINLVFQVTLCHTKLVGCANSGIGIHGSFDIGGLFFLLRAIRRNMVHNPAILHLGIAAVLADNTIKGNGIAHNRLLGQTVIANRTVGRICTINQDRTGAVGNVHITPGGAGDLGNHTGQVILTLSIAIMCLFLTDGYGFRNGQRNAGSGIGRLIGRFHIGQANQQTA